MALQKLLFSVNAAAKRGCIQGAFHGVRICVLVFEGYA